jgi:hypothetical protein
MFSMEEYELLEPIKTGEELESFNWKIPFFSKTIFKISIR